MKGFKNTGRGPKSGHSFSSKAGFSGSTGQTREVRGYRQGVPKRNFATGGMVVAKGTDGGSALTRRAKPVTGFDAQAGGKDPLRPGFNKGGKACYAEGGKVATVGAAIKMVKELMARGNSAEDAAAKAARRYGVSSSELKPKAAPAGGGGMPADKQMLAQGGRPVKGGRILQGGPVADTGGALDAIYGQGPRLGPPKGPIKAPGAVPSPEQMATSPGMLAPQGRAALIAAASRNPVQHHGSPAPLPGRRPARPGYGSFGRRPIVG